MRMGQKIHGIYTPVDEVVINYNAHCFAAGIDHKRFWWDGSSDPLDYTDDPGVVVVLDRAFGSLEQEQQIVWSLVARQQVKNLWWWPQFKTDAEHFFLRGNAEYPSWRQRWVRIKLTANYQQSPESVFKGERQMPGREISSVLAQHPEVARRMNGSAEHPFLWMAGLECKNPGDKCRLVPLAWIDGATGDLSVGADVRDYAGPYYAVPEFLEK